MIDIEQEIFKRIRTAVVAVYTGAVVYGEYVSNPTSFPAIMVQEIANNTYTAGQTTNKMENYGVVAYQIDIFTNGGTKKETCKSIAKIIDGVLLDLKFSRGMLNKISNEEGVDIYHIVGRYDAIVDEAYRIYAS